MCVLAEIIHALVSQEGVSKIPSAHARCGYNLVGVVYQARAT